jgi:quinol monooxygenase YgiN
MGGCPWEELYSVSIPPSFTLNPPNPGSAVCNRLSFPDTLKNDTIFTVSYMYAKPSQSSSATAILDTYTKQSALIQGNLAAFTLQRYSEYYRHSFTLVQMWTSLNELQAHRSSSLYTKMIDDFAPMQMGPPIVKTFYALGCGNYTQKVVCDDTVWTVTHIDTIPGYEKVSRELVVRSSLNASNAEGNLAYCTMIDLTPGRANHFTIVQAWTNLKSKIKFDDGSDALGFKLDIYPLGANHGGCPWGEEFSHLV